GNVLVRENNGDPYPLLVDFDHARLCSDTMDGSMRFGMGTVPFMSILNLAGYSHKLSILDELESFLYLLVWKCTIGFTPSDITRGKTARNTPQVTSVKSSANPLVKLVTRLKLTNRKSAALVQRSKHRVGQNKQLKIRSWAKGGPRGECLAAKYLHTSSDGPFELVLEELRPEFQVFKPLLLNLRRILFDWDGEQASFISGRNYGRRIVAPKDESRHSLNMLGPMEKLDQHEPKADQQAGDASTSNDVSVVDRYCSRLISRKNETDKILDNFESAMGSFYDNYF
ncbi:hypothetical protein IWQ62_002699, partial [Dispira parvispora]